MVAYVNPTDVILTEETDPPLIAMFAEILMRPVDWKPSTLFARHTDTWYRLRLPCAKMTGRQSYSEIVERHLSPNARRLLRAMFRVAKLLYKRNHLRRQSCAATLARFEKRARQRYVHLAIRVLRWGVTDVSPLDRCSS